MRLAVLLTGAIFGSLLMSAVQAAQEPATQAATAQSPATPAPPDNMEVVIQRYQSALQKELEEQGPYGRRVGEQLLGLGTAYSVAGKHRQAVSALTRAMYITRINDGLNTAAQLPILDAIIGQNLALHDWQALDKNYDYLYWVKRRNYGDNDARLLPVMDRVAHWKLEAFSKQVGKSPQHFLQEANTIFSDAVTLAEKKYGPMDPHVIDPLYGVAIANYELSSFYTILDQQARSLMSMNYDPYMPDATEAAYAEERDRQMSIMAAYARGTNALHRLLEKYKNNPRISAPAHVAALLHAGDWYLIMNRPDEATNVYSQAYTILRNSGTSADTLQKIFGRPRALTQARLTSPLPGSRVPDLVQELETEHKATTHFTAYVLTSLDVTDRGQPYNIHVLESMPPGDNSARRRAVEQVSSMLFRPRIENGRPVETDNFKFHIRFND